MAQKASKKSTTRKKPVRKPPKKKTPNAPKTPSAQSPRKRTPRVKPSDLPAIPRLPGGKIPPLGSSASGLIPRWRKMTLVLSAKTPTVLQKAIDKVQAVASNGDVSVRCVYSPSRGVPWFTVAYMERIDPT